MAFEFATASRITFGAGASHGLGDIARDHGRHAFVVTGRSPERASPLIARINAAGLGVTSFIVSAEPDVSTVERARALARSAGCDVVVGIGGGSVIDAAKAIAALATNDGDALDYLEVVGRGQPLTQQPLPCVAVPTTAGTGSEVTRNSVLGVPERGVKVSLRHQFMLPRVAIVDPDLTLTLPPLLSATTGLDALTQLIEPYVSLRANPMTDALCVEGIRLAAAALPAAVADGSDRAARGSMALASLWSGIALANAGLGAVHGFAGPIGGRFTAPHGAICAVLLPPVMDVNVRALQERARDAAALARFDHVAQLLTGEPAARAADGVAWTRALVARAGIPALSSYGVRAEHVPDLVERATHASSMKANPIGLTAGELAGILFSAM